MMAETLIDIAIKIEPLDESEQPLEKADDGHAVHADPEVVLEEKIKDDSVEISSVKTDDVVKKDAPVTSLLDSER